MSHFCPLHLPPRTLEDSKGRHPGHRDDGERRLEQLLLAGPGVQRSGDVHGRRLAVVLGGGDRRVDQEIVSLVIARLLEKTPTMIGFKIIKAAMMAV